MTGHCTICGRRCADHVATDGSWIGCAPLYPITLSWRGQLLILATTRDVYRICALDRKAA